MGGCRADGSMEAGEAVEELSSERDEIVPVLERHRLGRRKLEAKEIDELAVAGQAEIEVRPRGEPGCARPADDLALANLLAGLNEEGREVKVVRLEAARVV